jgi:NAD(P)-dependent dehydrogenase (short-subunit alcohol dehydrogenase family)
MWRYITNSSRGIRRGITLKLAQGGARIAVNYLQNKTAAEDTLRQVRAAGSDVVDEPRSRAGNSTGLRVKWI